MCPTAGFQHLLIRTLIYHFSIYIYSEPDYCTGWFYLKFSTAVFWNQKEKVHAEHDCNAHLHSSKQRRWMCHDSRQVPGAASTVDCLLSLGAHRGLGCSQLNSVLLQSKTCLLKSWHSWNFLPAHPLLSNNACASFPENGINSVWLLRNTPAALERVMGWISVTGALQTQLSAGFS